MSNAKYNNLKNVSLSINNKHIGIFEKIETIEVEHDMDGKYNCYFRDGENRITFCSTKAAFIGYKRVLGIVDDINICSTVKQAQKAQKDGYTFTPEA